MLLGGRSEVDSAARPRVADAGPEAAAPPAALLPHATANPGFWRRHWAGRSDLPNELSVGGRPSNRPSEFLQMISTLAKGLKMNRHDIVLDVGCANGLVVLALAPWVREIWACDFIHGMLSQARAVQDGTRNVRLFGADVRMLPLRTPMFTKVLMIGVLQCLRDRAEVGLALHGLHGVLQRGGALWLGWIPDADKQGPYLHGVEGLDLDEESKRNILERNRLALWLRRSELTELARSLGFQVHIQALSGSAWQSPYMFDAILTK